MSDQVASRPLAQLFERPLLPGEDFHAVDRFTKELISDYKPQNNIEHAAVCMLRDAVLDLQHYYRIRPQILNAYIPISFPGETLNEIPIDDPQLEIRNLLRRLLEGKPGAHQQLNTFLEKYGLTLENLIALAFHETARTQLNLERMMNSALGRIKSARSLLAKMSSENPRPLENNI